MIERELTGLMYELLSPKENRECGRLYLELFDKHVLCLDMTADELDGAQIYGEYPTQFIGRTRYIDLAIITSRRFIPIEGGATSYEKIFPKRTARALLLDVARIFSRTLKRNQYGLRRERRFSHSSR